MPHEESSGEDSWSHGAVRCVPLARAFPLLQVRMPAFSFCSAPLGRVALLAVLAGACGGGDRRAAVDAPRDDYGVVVDTVPVARRIVSLNPTTTEILFALGAGDRLVGRSRWDQWPDAARSVPDVGDAIRPSVERVLAAHPDLVVLYAGGDNRDAADALTRAGVRVVALRVDLIADFLRALRLLGALTAAEDAAGSIADSVSATLDAVRRATPPGAPRPTVFLHVWDNPLMAIGGGSFMSELVDIAGGRNVYADRHEPSTAISFEDLLRRNPDIILAGPIATAQLREAARWQSLPAVREGRVLTYDTTLVARPSVRLGEAARSLAALLRSVRSR